MNHPFGPLFINTLHKEYRNKTLLFLFIVTLVLIFFLNAVFNFFLTPMEGQLITIPGLVDKKLTIFYTLISLWGGFLATLLGVGCVRSDFDFQVISQLLSLPLKRRDYLLARILGTWPLVTGYYFLSLCLAMMVFSLSNQELTLSGRIPLAILVNSLAYLTLITLGVLFSLFFSKLLSFLGVSLLAFFITLSNSFILHKEGPLLQQFSSGLLPTLATILHYLFPRLGVIGQIASTLVYQQELDFNLWLEAGHFMASFTLLIFTLQQVFKVKEQGL